VRGARRDDAAWRGIHRAAVSGLPGWRVAGAARHASHRALHLADHGLGSGPLPRRALSRPRLHRREPGAGLRLGARAGATHADSRPEPARHSSRSPRRRSPGAASRRASRARATGALLDRARGRGLAEPAGSSSGCAAQRRSARRCARAGRIPARAGRGRREASRAPHLSDADARHGAISPLVRAHQRAVLPARRPRRAAGAISCGGFRDAVDAASGRCIDRSRRRCSHAAGRARHARASSDD